MIEELHSRSWRDWRNLMDGSRELNWRRARSLFFVINKTVSEVGSDLMMMNNFIVENPS